MVRFNNNKKFTPLTSYRPRKKYLGGKLLPLKEDMTKLALYCLT